MSFFSAYCCPGLDRWSAVPQIIQKMSFFKSVLKKSELKKSCPDRWMCVYTVY